jgi:hypothetical protein
MSIGGSYAVTAHEIRGGRQLADLTIWLEDWEAVDELNDLGQFSGTVLVSPECCEVLLPLEPWLTELRVTHGGTDVAWEGVLTSSPIAMGMDPGSEVELSGTSMLGWLSWRVVRDVIDTTDAPIDACLWALQVIQSALEVNDPQLLDYLTIHSGGESIERVATMGKLAWDSNLRGILGKQVDIANHGRAITVRPAGACFGDLGAWGANLFDGKWVLQRESTRDQPFATVAWVRGADGLLMSVGTEVNGLLVETSIDDSAIIDQEQAYAAGASAITLDGRAPLQFLSDNAVISCDAGIDPCDLMPGACVVVQVESCGQPHEQQMRVLSVRHAGNAAGEDSTEVELAVLPNSDRKAFPDPGPTEPTQAVSLRPIILHDTRLWTGDFEDTYPTGYLQNLGTGRTADGEYNWQVPVFDTSPSYFVAYATSGQILVQPEFADFAADGYPVEWELLGGRPNEVPFTFVLAVGDLADSSGDALGQVQVGPNFGIYFSQDITGYQVFVADPSDHPSFPLEIDYNAGTPLTNEIIFVEQDFTTDTPTAAVWIGETQVAIASHTSAYSLDDVYPTSSTFYLQYGYAAITHTPGDPFPIIGGAMLRGKLTPGQREAWRSYFLD